MLCSRARTALSARLDSEALPPGVTERKLQTHLAGCADCRAWEVKALRLQGFVADEAADGGAASAADAVRAGSDGPGPAAGSSARRAC